MMQALRQLVALGLVVAGFGAGAAAHAAGWSGVIDFGASWCGPCRQMAPIVERLKKEGLPIRAVDVDADEALAQKYRINSYPTFVLIVDDREVDRVSGAMSEADLRRLLDRIPLSKITEAREPVGVVLGAAEAIPVALSASNPRPAEQPVQQTRVADASTGEERSGLWPFGKKTASSPTVRGNDDTVQLGNPVGFTQPAVAQAAPGAGVANAVSPMAASNRIRVSIDDHVNLGSGTVISSREGNTLILTCGHIFRGFNDRSKIEVDLFQNGQARTIVARLEKYDLESDLGLIAISTPEPVPAVPVAGSRGLPEVGMQLACIGCSGGDDPTRDQIRVTSIDKYEGPNNIECTGIPVQGRSGGGLFNSYGQLVGVCIASDPKEQRGLYSGLLAVHQLLNQCNLAHLYQSGNSEEALAQAAPVTPVPTQPAPAELAFNSTAPETSPAAFGTNPAPPASPAAPAPKSMAVSSAGAEAVIILTDKDHPELPHRVVIIHDVSPKFMQYLSGEFEEPAAEFSQVTPVSVEEPVTRPAPLPMLARTLRTHSDMPMPVVDRLPKSQFAPTTLSRPRARAYVRSSATR